MLYNQRVNYIMEQLQTKSVVRINDLVKEMNLSVDTIRRDLKKLEEEGILKYVRGGACLVEEPPVFSPFDVRKIDHVSEKKEAIKNALSLIKDGDVIAMNSGTTNALLAEELVYLKKNITVITNNVSAINAFLNAPHLKVIVPGGYLDSKEKAFYGHTCEKEFNKYNTDLCFLSINAISEEQGYTDFRFNDIDIMRTLVKRTKKTIAIMDSSKFGKVSQKNIFKLNEIDMLVSDSKLDPKMAQRLIELGVNLVF